MTCVAWSRKMRTKFTGLLHSLNDICQFNGKTDSVRLQNMILNSRRESKFQHDKILCCFISATEAAAASPAQPFRFRLHCICFMCIVLTVTSILCTSSLDSAKHCHFITSSCVCVNCDQCQKQSPESVTWLCTNHKSSYHFRYLIIISSEIPLSV